MQATSSAPTPLSATEQRLIDTLLTIERMSVGTTIGRTASAALLLTQDHAAEQPRQCNYVECHLIGSKDPIKFAINKPEHTPPLPGHPWPAQGGTYIGIAPAEGNLPARHLVMLDIEPSTKLNWANAVQWAQTHGNGARLPTQLEALFAFTTAKAAFKPEWHWTLTQYDRSNAFCQSFQYGGSGWDFKDGELRVRACRGLALQTFTPLSLDPAGATTPSGA